MKQLITCKELVDFLGDYYEGELPPPQKSEFDRHLAVCPSCIHYVETYKATIEVCRTSLCSDGDAPPADVPEALIQAILAARKKGK